MRLTKLEIKKYISIYNEVITEIESKPPIYYLFDIRTEASDRLKILFNEEKNNLCRRKQKDLIEIWGINPFIS